MPRTKVPSGTRPKRDREEYGGAVQLRSPVSALTAIGMINTRLPDGTPGFSLLVIVSAEFTGVQLGFGFTLNAGRRAHRHQPQHRRRAAARGAGTGALDPALLFPRDVVRQAPRLFTGLRTLFPVTVGRHVIGPMIRIGWGTPRSSPPSSGCCWSCRRRCG